MEFQNRFLLHARLSELGVDIKTQHILEEIKGNKVVIVDLQSSERKAIEAHFIVVALGVTPNNDFANALKERPMEIYFVGDCAEPRKAVNAIHQESFIARQI